MSEVLPAAENFEETKKKFLYNILMGDYNGNLLCASYTCKGQINSTYKRTTTCPFHRSWSEIIQPIAEKLIVDNCVNALITQLYNILTSGNYYDFLSKEDVTKVKRLRKELFFKAEAALVTQDNIKKAEQDLDLLKVLISFEGLMHEITKSQESLDTKERLEAFPIFEVCIKEAEEKLERLMKMMN